MSTLAAQKTSAKSHAASLPRRKWRRYNTWVFYLFISPWLIGFIALTLIPFAYAFLVSFTNFDGFSDWRWIGLKNYIDAFKDVDAWYGLRQTLLYTVITVPLGVAGGLGLALLLNRNSRPIGIFRALCYLPAVVPIVAGAIIWRTAFDRDSGILNALIEAFHGPTTTWLVDPYAFFALLIMVLWGIGGGMVISLAGLQGIPQELREAARVDGGNAWQVFRLVTLPLLTPVLFFQGLTGCIGALQTMIQPLLLVQTGAPVPRGNYLYMIHVYEQFFSFQRFGYGSALLWILFVIILLFTILVFRSSPYWVYYEVERTN